MADTKYSLDTDHEFKIPDVDSDIETVSYSVEFTFNSLDICNYPNFVNFSF